MKNILKFVSEYEKRVLPKLSEGTFLPKPNTIYQKGIPTIYAAENIDGNSVQYDVYLVGNPHDFTEVPILERALIHGVIAADGHQDCEGLCAKKRYIWEKQSAALDIPVSVLHFFDRVLIRGFALAHYPEIPESDEAVTVRLEDAIKSEYREAQLVEELSQSKLTEVMLDDYACFLVHYSDNEQLIELLDKRTVRFNEDPFNFYLQLLRERLL